MTTITADVSKMFDAHDPWDVSNSIANLGQRAGEITWENALEIARKRDEWLRSPVEEACEGMREWCRDTGAWDEDELAGYTVDDLLGMFVQNVAGELRGYLKADDVELMESLQIYRDTDWDAEPGSPTGYYYPVLNQVLVDYYTGC